MKPSGCFASPLILTLSPDGGEGTRFFFTSSGIKRRFFPCGLKKVRKMEKEIINYIVYQKCGDMDALRLTAREIVDKYPGRSEAQKTKEANWMITKLELLGYIGTGQTVDQKLTWGSTERAIKEQHLMREPTLSDKLKGWVLRHVYHVTIEL